MRTGVNYGCEQGMAGGSLANLCELARERFKSCVAGRALLVRACEGARGGGGVALKLLEAARRVLQLHRRRGQHNYPARDRYEATYR